jgi:hypothetical protein
MTRTGFRSVLFVTTVVVTCITTAAASCGSDSHSSSGGSSGGSLGGAVGGSSGGGAAAGGAAGAVEVPTEINICTVEFSPAAAGPSNALGMVWGKGIITFAVSVTCPKAQSRGSLDYAIFHTGRDNGAGNLADNEIDSPSFPMAGVVSKTFPVVLKCDPGMWLFEYRWNGTISGASTEKQDANSGTGILLTSVNCK